MRIPIPVLAGLVLLVVSFPVTHLLIERQIEQQVLAVVTESTQASNATIARIFVNEVLPRIDSPLALEQREKAPPPSGEALELIDREVRRFMFGTDVLKVKLYRLDGLTVYSTEAVQIGQSGLQNPAFQAALQGVTGSEITHRETFKAADGDVFDRDLVSSYIPIRDGNGLIIGVAEIYTDRTPVLLRSGARDALHPLLTLGQTLQLLLILFVAWAVWSWLLRRQDPEQESP